MANLEVGQTVPNGPVGPGTNFSHYLHRDGNTDNVPDTGFQWSITRDGKALNFADLSALTESPALHTWNRKEFGFKLKPEVGGVFRVFGSGHGISFTAKYEVQAVAPDVNARLASIEEKLDTLLTLVK